MDVRGPGWKEGATAWATPPKGKGFGLLANQWNYAAQHGVSALFRKFAYRIRPPRPIAFNFEPWLRESPWGDDYWRVLRGCRVCVGVNRYPSLRFPIDHPDRYSRLRDIEAPMAGAAYLTEFAPGLDKLYEIGREIEVYRDAAELAAKTEELGRDAPRRRKLREQGQRRALGDHGIAQTVAKIAHRLGFG
jgi:hypothetical protein